MSSVSATGGEEAVCSIARTLEVVGDKWTLLVLREATLRGVTRFADFRQELGIAPDLLTGRLTTLVDQGIMERRPYREPGSRTRYGYHLTAAGEELRLVLAAFQQWGDTHRTPARGPAVLRRSVDGGRPVSVAFVDDAGAVLPAADVEFTPSDGAAP
ncbi:helix-turn-helix domain-containing protein [Streptomyces sp. NPDC005722]